MSRRFIVALALVFGMTPGLVGRASAQTSTSSFNIALSGTLASTALPGVLKAEDLQLPAQQPRLQLAQDFSRPSDSRALFTSLYVSTAALQALDVVSTVRALNAGAVEGNPMMSPLTRNKAAFIAVKAGVAASTILAARSMAKRNKVAAIVTLAAINSAYAMVVSHNFRIANGIQ